MENFRIVCLKCQKLNVKHHTVLYVDWGKKVYTVFCEECGTAEYYDEFGELMESRKKRDGEIN